jgi:hypothetical protein
MTFVFGRPSCRRALRCIGAPNLRTYRRAFRCRHALRLRCRCTLGNATCGHALHCVGAPNLWTGLVLCLGAHLADVPCVVLGRPTLVRSYQKVYLQAKICSYPSSSSSFSLVLPCVDVFVADEFCVWATILRTCLAFPWGAQLADMRTCLAFALRTCAGARNLRTCLVLHWCAQLADVHCVALGCPTCGRALCCIWAPILRTCLTLRWGAQPW